MTPGSQGGCGGTSFPSRPGPAPPALLPFHPPQVVAPKDLPFELSHKQMNLLTAPISSAPGGLHDETASLHSGSQAKQINVRCICCRLNIWKSHFINIFFPQRHPHMAASSGPCSQRCRRPQALCIECTLGVQDFCSWPPRSIPEQRLIYFGGHIRLRGDQDRWRPRQAGLAVEVRGTPSWSSLQKSSPQPFVCSVLSQVLEFPKPRFLSF